MPIVAGSDGMAAGFSPREKGTAGESRGHLSALLSQVLLAYTLDFERESELSLPLSSNFVRVLDDVGLRVAELPRAAGSFEGSDEHGTDVPHEGAASSASQVPRLRRSALA